MTLLIINNLIINLNKGYTMIEVHAYITLKGNWFVNGVIKHRVYSDTYRNCSKDEAIKQFKIDARKAYKRYINNNIK